MLHYLFFENTRLLDLLIKHLNRNSIAECLLKILVSSTQDLKDEEPKRNLLADIINAIDVTDVEKCENITELLCESLSNRKIYNIFVKSPELLELLHKKIFSSQYKKFLKVLIKLNEHILKDFSLIPNNPCKNYSLQHKESIDQFNPLQYTLSYEDDNFQNAAEAKEEIEYKNYTLIIQIIDESISSLFRNFDKIEEEIEIETTFQEKIKKLGSDKIVEIQYLKILLDVCIIGLACNLEAKIYFERILMNLIENKVIQSCYDYLYEFKFNNFLQNEVEKLTEIICYKDTPEYLIRSIFSSQFLDRLVKNTLDHEFTFVSGFEGLKGNIINLSNIANVISKSENQTLKEIQSESDFLLKLDKIWKFFVSVFIEPLISSFYLGLLYDQTSI